MKLKEIVTWPFRYGFEVVDARPTGSAYRRVANQLKAIDGDNKDEILLVIGKDKVDRMPVGKVITASTTVEAANATLKMMGALRRSEVRAINKKVRDIEAEVAKTAKAQEAVKAAEQALAKASGGSAGKEEKAQTVPGKTIRTAIHSADSSPVVGDPVLV